jgi:hypothetical protein
MAPEMSFDISWALFVCLASSSLSPPPHLLFCPCEETGFVIAQDVKEAVTGDCECLDQVSIVIWIWHLGILS